MAVVNVLPNGFLLVTLSTREAVLLNDQILDPEDFPWQTSEAQMIAMEVKTQIKRIVEDLNSNQTHMINEIVQNMEENEREKERIRQAEEELRRRAQEAQAQQEKPKE